MPSGANRCYDRGNVEDVGCIFAEIEANLISARIKSGMANAKAKGKQIGRFATTVDDIPTTFIKHYGKLKNGEVNVTEMAKLCGLARGLVYKYRDLLEKGDKNSLNIFIPLSIKK